MLRDRPFNLKRGGGELWFFVSFRMFFSDITRVRIFIFFVAQSANFCPEFNIRLYDKNSESDFFFSSNKIRIFFSATLGIRIFFLEKKHIPPPPPPFNKGNNKITELRTILQRESQNS